MASTGSLNMPPTASPIPETCPAINKTAAAVPTTAKAKKSRSKHKAAAAAAVAVKKDVQSVEPSKADSDDGTVNDVDLQKRLQINSSVPETTATTSPTEDADAPPQTNGHDVNAEKASAVDPASSAPSTKEPTDAGAAAAVAPAADSAAAPVAAAAPAVDPSAISYVIYQNELQMPDIMRLIQKDLSEPYSIYTYRYFIHNWPKLCFLAMHNEVCVGAIVCKLDIHRQTIKRGYIAMLAVDKDYRKLQIGTKLVQNAIQAMLSYDADEVVLETEITNTPALRLYENLGFVRDKRLFGYYLNGVDALRLKLWFR